MINEFCNSGGIDKLLSLVIWEKKCKIKDEKGFIHTPPLVLSGLLRVLNSITTRMLPELSNANTSNFLQGMHTYFSSFAVNFDVHFSDVDKILMCFKFYESLAERMTTKEGFRFLDTEEGTLVMLVRYLTCPIFEKKFTAINMLNSRIQIYIKGSEKEKEKYRNILLKTQIPTILYISGYHPEIAKKSDEVMAFLAPKLPLSIIKSLMTSAFEQSSEKGGVICLCLRKSLQVLDIEVNSFHKLIKNVLEILSTSIPIERMDSHTIQLIVEIIKQSGEKTSRFSFLKNSKDGTKIVEDSIQLLWSCLDSKSNVVSSDQVKSIIFENRA